MVAGLNELVLAQVDQADGVQRHGRTEIVAQLAPELQGTPVVGDRVIGPVGLQARDAQALLQVGLD